MRSTYPLSPHVDREMDRRVLARVLQKSRSSVLTMAAARHHWARGYHARIYAEMLLRTTLRKNRLPELEPIYRRLLTVVTTAPMWRGRIVSGYEAKELATDGPIEKD